MDKNKVYVVGIIVLLGLFTILTSLGNNTGNVMENDGAVVGQAVKHGVDRGNIGGDKSRVAIPRHDTLDIVAGDINEVSASCEKLHKYGEKLPESDSVIIQREINNLNPDLKTALVTIVAWEMFWPPTQENTIMNDLAGDFRHDLDTVYFDWLDMYGVSLTGASVDQDGQPGSGEFWEWLYDKAMGRAINSGLNFLTGGLYGQLTKMFNTLFDIGDAISGAKGVIDAVWGVMSEVVGFFFGGYAEMVMDWLGDGLEKAWDWFTGLLEKDDKDKKDDEDCDGDDCGDSLEVDECRPPLPTDMDLPMCDPSKFDCNGDGKSPDLGWGMGNIFAELGFSPLELAGYEDMWQAVVFSPDYFDAVNRACPNSALVAELDLFRSVTHTLMSYAQSERFGYAVYEKFCSTY